MAGIYVNHSPPGARSIKVGVLTGIFFQAIFSDFSLYVFNLFTDLKKLEQTENEKVWESLQYCFYGFRVINIE